MSAEAIGCFIKVNIVICPIQSPECCDPRTAAADNCDLFPGVRVRVWGHVFFFFPGLRRSVEETWRYAADERHKAWCELMI